VHIAYFIAVIVIALGFELLKQLSAIRKALLEICNLLTSIDERTESLRDVGDQVRDLGDHVDDIADLARTYKKYNTFPLGQLDRPLIGSESEYDR
jgi:hypothetical protein